jgi:hypothetical protein
MLPTSTPLTCDCVVPSPGRAGRARRHRADTGWRPSIPLAARAAAFDVPVDLQVRPGLRHVFQRYAGTGQLDQADAAMDAAGNFLRHTLTPVPAIA